MSKKEHIPVLLDEILSTFNGKEINYFLDGTCGLGGHAAAILNEHNEIKKYIAIDKDVYALKKAKSNLKKYKNIKFYQDSFENFDNILRKEKINKIDGFLFDLGVSSLQLDSEERGFSFNKDGPLDMRMDVNQSLTAEEVVNTYSEEKLIDIFENYGEEKNSKKIVKKITSERKKKKIQSTKQLAELIVSVKRQTKKIHPATLVFQALRIYVNSELDVLEKTLEKACKYLNEKGLLAVISFHSLEDRIVKNFFKKISERKKVNKYKEEKPNISYKMINKKPIVPSLKEIKINKRSRSAKLRILERVKDI